MTRIFLAVLAALLVASCASDPAETDVGEGAVVEQGATVERDMPAWVEVSLSSPSGAGVDEDGNLVIVTMGSSTNPLVLTSISVEGQTITAAIENDPDKPATMDLVPTTSSIPLPKTVSTDEPITVDLGDWGPVVIEPGPPSFTWVEVSDEE